MRRYLGENIYRSVYRMRRRWMIFLRSLRPNPTCLTGKETDPVERSVYGAAENWAAELEGLDTAS
jgi:hypothetical protein